MSNVRRPRRPPPPVEAVDYSEPLGRAVERTRSTATERWTDEQFRRQREVDLAGSEVSSGSVLRAMVLCLVVAGLLSSDKLVEITERQPFGWQRDVTSTIAHGIDRLANLVALNRPADAIASWRDHGDDAGQRLDVIDEEALGVEPVEVVVPPETTEPPPSSTTTTPTPPATIRAASPARPVVVRLIGDSQAEFLGFSLEREATERAGALEVQTDARVSTGLARPDAFNWPAQLQAVLDEQAPDAVIVFMGANDYQDIAVDGQVLSRGSPAWRAEYARRVAIMMDLVVADDRRRMLWIAQPPMRDATLDEGMGIVNQLSRAAARDRPGVVWVDAHQMFGGAAGYSLDIDDPVRGDAVVRQGDGVHLSRTGADWLADEVLADIDRFWPPVGDEASSPSTTRAPGS